MKQYTGTKTLNAQPMTLGKYNEFRGWKLPSTEDFNAAGYLIEYLDGSEANTEKYVGYISWSPKSIFEASYRVSDTYNDRLVIEYVELEEKLLKLTNFLYTDNFSQLSVDEQGLLTMQASIMSDYLTILDTRKQS